MKAYVPNLPSSVRLATTSFRAHMEEKMEGSTRSNDTKFQQHQVQNFVIPRFIPPFCHKRNPLEEEAIQAAQQWYCHYFADSTMTLETFYKMKNMNFQTIPVSVHSTAKLSHLEWAFEFYMFLFSIDDVVGHKTRSSSLEDLEEFFLELMVVIISSFPEDHLLEENLTKYFDDEIDHKLTKDFAEKVLARAMQHSKTDFDEHKVSPVCAAFSNLWSRATSEMPKEWNLRYARIIQQSMLSQFLEARNLFLKKSPSISTYMSQRNEFGYMNAALGIIDYVDDVFLPNTLYYNPTMQRLLQATGDVACWHNDIYSFQKELMDGEVYNLVIIIGKEEGSSYNKAAEFVNQMVLDKLEEIHYAIADLRIQTQNTNEITTSQMVAIEQYITGCTNFISSTHEFHSQSSRFHV